MAMVEINMFSGNAWTLHVGQVTCGILIQRQPVLKYIVWGSIHSLRLLLHRRPRDSKQDRHVLGLVPPVYILHSPGAGSILLVATGNISRAVAGVGKNLFSRCRLELHGNVLSKLVSTVC
jgi:hypothetical protein